MVQFKYSVLNNDKVSRAISVIRQIIERGLGIEILYEPNDWGKVSRNDFARSFLTEVASGRNFSSDTAFFGAYNKLGQFSNLFPNTKEAYSDLEVEFREYYDSMNENAATAIGYSLWDIIQDILKTSGFEYSTKAMKGIGMRSYLRGRMKSDNVYDVFLRKPVDRGNVEAYIPQMRFDDNDNKFTGIISSQVVYMDWKRVLNDTDPVQFDFDNKQYDLAIGVLLQKLNVLSNRLGVTFNQVTGDDDYVSSKVNQWNSDRKQRSVRGGDYMSPTRSYRSAYRADVRDDVYPCEVYVRKDKEFDDYVIVLANYPASSPYDFETSSPTGGHGATDYRYIQKQTVPVTPEEAREAFGEYVSQFGNPGDDGVPLVLIEDSSNRNIGRLERKWKKQREAEYRRMMGYGKSMGMRGIGNMRRMGRMKSDEVIKMPVFVRRPKERSTLEVFFPTDVESSDGKEFTCWDKNSGHSFATMDYVRTQTVEAPLDEQRTTFERYVKNNQQYSPNIEYVFYEGDNKTISRYSRAWSTARRNELARMNAVGKSIRSLGRSSIKAKQTYDVFVRQNTIGYEKNLMVFIPAKPVTYDIVSSDYNNFLYVSKYGYDGADWSGVFDNSEEVDSDTAKFFIDDIRDRLLGYGIIPNLVPSSNAYLNKKKSAWNKTRIEEYKRYETKSVRSTRSYLKRYSSPYRSSVVNRSYVRKYTGNANTVRAHSSSRSYLRSYIGGARKGLAKSEITRSIMLASDQAIPTILKAFSNLELEPVMARDGSDIKVDENMKGVNYSVRLYFTSEKIDGYVSVKYVPEYNPRKPYHVMVYAGEADMDFSGKGRTKEASNTLPDLDLVFLMLKKVCYEIDDTFLG